MAEVLHLTGPILRGPDEVVGQAWVIGGRLTFERPAGSHDVTTLAGHVVPGLVDAHAHIGLDGHGATDDATAGQQGEGARDDQREEIEPLHRRPVGPQVAAADFDDALRHADEGHHREDVDG